MYIRYVNNNSCFSFSFQELREVRVAFQLYEHEDMLGLVTDEHILLRTLKVSDLQPPFATLAAHHIK